MKTAGLGEVGCGLPKQRTSGELPKEAKAFLEVLFEKGEIDSSEKVSSLVLITCREVVHFPENKFRSHLRKRLGALNKSSTTQACGSRKGKSR